MGHKVNPVGLRVGINRTWDSRWYANTGEYGRLLHEDMRVREHIMKMQRQAGISKVVIERPHKKCRVTVHTARPGVLIGKKGADIDKLRGQLSQLTDSEVHLNVVEVRKPEIDATLIAEGIAQQLERRVAFRRAMKRAVQSALRLGALGVRINCAGRLGGAEIARTEWYREGRISISVTGARRPLTGSSGSRSGSSRARSWSTIRWHPSAGRSRCRKVAAAVAGMVIVATARAPDAKL
jgi:small subunit ribosomal protein S3